MSSSSDDGSPVVIVWCDRSARVATIARLVRIVRGFVEKSCASVSDIDLTEFAGIRLHYGRPDRSNGIAVPSEEGKDLTLDVRIAEKWMKPAGDIERTTPAPTPVDSNRPRLNPVDAKAIAEFLKSGGQIARVKDPVTATEQEVIDFLATCGVTAKYLPGDMKAYWCNNRRVSMTALVRLANTYRYSQELAPFAIRLIPSPRKK